MPAPTLPPPAMYLPPKLPERHRHAEVFRSWEMRALLRGIKTTYRRPRQETQRPAAAVGDRVVVLERWRRIQPANRPPSEPGPLLVSYCADKAVLRWDVHNGRIACTLVHQVDIEGGNGGGDANIAGLWLPACWSRFQLEVTKVERQPLDAITEDEAQVEGAGEGELAEVTVPIESIHRLWYLRQWRARHSMAEVGLVDVVTFKVTWQAPAP